MPVRPSERYPSEFISLLESYNIISPKGPSYEFTDKGRDFQKKMLE